MLRDVVRTRLRNLHEYGTDSARAGEVLDAMPVSGWPGLIAKEPCLQTLAGLHQVLDRARAELYRDAGAALHVINAVLALPVPDVVLRGRALRLLSHAFHRQAEGTRAREVLNSAMTLLVSSPDGALELLHARLFEAYLRNETGESDVLLEVRIIAKAFAAHGDARGALHARAMEAAILFERNEFQRAMRVNRDALAIAESLTDEYQQAIALGNQGHCAQQLALIAHKEEKALRAAAYADEALSYFARATPLYAALRMDAESQKIVWAIASIARQRGYLAEARSRLVAVREELLQRRMFLAAALVALDLMELLVMVDRHDLVIPWYEEATATFVHAGMPRYALDAFARVQAAAARRPLDARALSRIRADVRERFTLAA